MSKRSEHDPFHGVALGDIVVTKPRCGVVRGQVVKIIPRAKDERGRFTAAKVVVEGDGGFGQFTVSPTDLELLERPS